MLAPARVDSLARQKAIQVACGGAHSLVLLDRGQIYSFGAGRDGVLSPLSPLLRA
jgi:alpha-tubulin suppressor-like RCC1 family protein